MNDLRHAAHPCYQQHQARARGQLDQHVRREAHIGQGHSRLHDQGFICVKYMEAVVVVLEWC